MIHIHGRLNRTGRSNVERGRAGATFGGVLGALVGTCAVSLTDLGQFFESAPTAVLLSGVVAAALIGAMAGAFLGATFGDTPARLSR
ncbi:MAG TPA: hypothetical protein VK524_09875 [Polyangiaceae bacterium]|nr:hypothetical protein [Polyangiaceae bacterium]